MDPKTPAEQIVYDKMYANDAFSKWLGIEILSIKPGYSKLQLTIKPDHLNGFQIAHGGISYSLADSALAFAANGHGIQSVSIETSISHTKATQLGDVLTATATELSLGTKFGIYEVRVTNQKNDTIALFKGTVFRTSKNWEL